MLVAHPGMQHAHQLAWALEEAGYLVFFCSGVPVVDSRCPSHGFWGAFGRRLRAIPIAAEKRSHAVVFPLMRRLFGLGVFKPIATIGNQLLDRVHDLWVAQLVAKLKPDLVVCYENSALHTFRAARSIGAVCVLDAASIHYESGRVWLADVGQVNATWINANKQREIDLADAILNCSEFAAETYRAAGVPAGKIFAVPLGTNLPANPFPQKAGGGVVDFVFAGSLRRLKGVDVLLDVFEELGQQGAPARLTLIGGIAESDLADRTQKLPNVTHQPFMAQPELFLEIARHDCLILPSRFDSFGMVVAEAMAVGVPAIVSDRVGAKCIIEQHPEAGWIVACEKEALKAQILRVMADPEGLAAAGRAARSAAREYSWEAYRRRVVRTLECIYQSAGKNA